VANYPDLVVVDDTVPLDNIREVSANFPTVMLTKAKGKSPIPTVDYTFDSPEDVRRFLQEYASKPLRERLIDLYDVALGTRYPQRVKHVAYYGYSRYLYNVVARLLNSPLKPWIGLYGPSGAGKMNLLRAVLGHRLKDAFHITSPSMGFRLNREEVEDVVVDVSMFHSEEEIRAVMSEIHRRRYQAIFIVEREGVPEILKTVPFFYVPPLSERPPKERLLLLEHMLRKIEEEMGGDGRIEVEEAFMQVFYSYPWPNNLSELDNVLRFVLGLNGGSLSVDALPYHIKVSASRDGTPPAWERYQR